MLVNVSCGADARLPCISTNGGWTLGVVKFPQVHVPLTGTYSYLPGTYLLTYLLTTSGDGSGGGGDGGGRLGGGAQW